MTQTSLIIKTNLNTLPFLTMSKLTTFLRIIDRLKLNLNKEKTINKDTKEEEASRLRSTPK